MASAMLGVEELQLDEDEAKQLATSINDVRQYYDASFVDEKTMAWVNLALAAGTVYGPRAIAWNVRRKKEAAMSPVSPGIRPGPTPISQQRPTVVTPPPSAGQQPTRPVTTVVNPPSPVRDFVSAGVVDTDEGAAFA